MIKPHLYLSYYRKQILFGLLIVLVVLAGLLVIFSSGILSNPNFFRPVTSIARLEIDIDGHKRAFEGEVIDGMTVFEALQASALAGNISFNYAINNDSKLVVKSLDGYEAEKVKKPPTILLNSTPVETEKIHLTPIKAGDIVEIYND